MPVFILILLFCVLFAAVVLYVAHKSQKLWVQFLVGFGLMFGVGFACMQLGLAIGKTLNDSNQYGARRMIGIGLAAMAEDAEAGRYEALSAKAIYLNEHWYELDFTLHDDGQSVQALMDTLKKTTGSTTPSVDPSASQ